MNTKLEQQLINDFPSFFRNHNGDPKKTCMAQGIQCGDGWHDIICEACKEIKEYCYSNSIDFYFEQIKEKWATLTIYGMNADKQINLILSDAEKKSEKLVKCVAQ